MKINWKVRIKNKAWWLAIVPAVLLLIKMILDMFGISYDFSELQDKLIALIGAIFSVLAILGIVADPTTEGIQDSSQALSYEEPKQHEEG